MTNGAAFNVTSFWQSEWEAHAETVSRTRKDLFDAFAQMLDACIAAINRGNKIMFIGNGGSAADAQHLATELTVRYKKDRLPIAAIALTTDTSALTAIGNDFGFDQLFARQVAALGKPGDVLIAISTSGNSQNVLTALDWARRMKITTVGFTGGTGGKMLPALDIALCVPSNVTARIQEMHISFGQMLCGGLEQALGLVPVETADTAAASAQKTA
jgi:D-sedoheptulose 7-phosphate isomerase